MPWAKPQASAAPTQAPAAASARLNDPGVLALVNGAPLKSETFRRRVEALPEDSPSGFSTTFGTVRIIHRKPRTADEKKILLEELVKEELLVQDAASLGLERDPVVRGQLEDSRRLIILTAATKREADKVKLEESEIEDHYNRFKDVYKDPERIRLSQIVTPSQQEAEAARAAAVQGEEFAQLARTRSIDSSKAAGGDVGWFLKALDHQILTQTGQNPAEKFLLPQFEPVAFSLEVGQISQPVKGPDGYYLFRLGERKPQRVPSLNELHDRLREGLLAQKRQKQIQDHLDRISQKGSVQLNEPRLEAE